jgi:hypothetical protein
MTSNAMKILKKRENALLEKDFTFIFSTFFLLKSLSDPFIRFKKTKKIHYTEYFLKISKNIVLHKNYLWKSNFQNLNMHEKFKFFLYSVEGAQCGSWRVDADGRKSKQC